MLLFPRGYFKTSINTIAHTIQWLLNYPQIAIADLFSVDSKAQHVLKDAIKEPFQHNKLLRELFPEYCPRRAVNDWGNAESFTLENRREVLHRLGLPPRVEPSVMAQSLDKGQAGYHFDIIKCSDIVEENNVQTPSQREQVKKRFGLLPKMLVKRPDGIDGWIDLEGTFYHPDDLHAAMIKHWLDEDEGKHACQIFINGVFKRDTKGMPPKHDPWEMAFCPVLLDDKGKRMPIWPTADPIEKLEVEEKHPLEGGYVFATQRALDFKSDTTGMRPFSDPITWISRADFQKVPIVYSVTTIDLADTDGPKANNGVITTCGYDRFGRVYVHNIQRGKWGPEEAVKRMFETHKKYKPARMVIEDYAYTHGLKPTIDRTSHMTGVYPAFEYVPADRTQKKVQRIINSLQAPFKSGELRFVDPLDAEDPAVAKLLRNALETELTECTMFSTGSSDDILDALANQYMTRDWSGYEGLGGAQGPLTPEAYERLLNQQYNVKIREEDYKRAHQKMVYGEEEHATPRSPFLV